MISDGIRHKQQPTRSFSEGASESETVKYVLLLPLAATPQERQILLEIAKFVRKEIQSPNLERQTSTAILAALQKVPPFVPHESFFKLPEEVITDTYPDI